MSEPLGFEETDDLRVIDWQILHLMEMLEAAERKRESIDWRVCQDPHPYL